MSDVNVVSLNTNYCEIKGVSFMSIHKKSYKPEFYGVLTAIHAIGFWYLSSLAIEKSVIPQQVDYIVKFIIAGTSSFFGAYFAFYLRKSEDVKEIREKRVEDINKSLLAILTRLALYNNLQDKFFKYPGEVEASLNLRQLKVPSSAPFGENISFLLRINPFMFATINETQILDSDLLSLMEARNILHNEIIKTHFNDLQGRTINYDELKSMVGELNARDLVDYSREIREGLHKMSNNLIVIGNDIFEAAKLQYPNEKFLKMPQRQGNK